MQGVSCDGSDLWKSERFLRVQRLAPRLAGIELVERMASLLAPDALLILDPPEHPGGAQPLFTAGAGGVHSPRHASCPKRAPSRVSGPSRP